MVWIEIPMICPPGSLLTLVTTFAVVWIEIIQEVGTSKVVPVTTFAVVWIEISLAVGIWNL